MKEITVLNNQSLFDISVQEYGTVEGVFELAQANDLGITDILTAGQILKVQELDSNIMQPEIVAYYRKNNIHPATGETKVAETVIPVPPSDDGCYWEDLK